MKTAAAKGLVIGGFQLMTEDGNIIQHNHDSEVWIVSLAQPTP